MEHRSHTRLSALFPEDICKVCSDNSSYFVDGRALKRHYRERSVHSASELTKAVVKLWTSISSDPESMEAVCEVNEVCGIIELAVPSDKEDPVCLDEWKYLASSGQRKDQAEDSEPSEGALVGRL